MAVKIDGPRHKNIQASSSCITKSIPPNRYKCIHSKSHPLFWKRACLQEIIPTEENWFRFHAYYQASSSCGCSLHKCYFRPLGQSSSHILNLFQVNPHMYHNNSPPHQYTFLNSITHVFWPMFSRLNRMSICPFVWIYVCVSAHRCNYLCWA